MTRVARRSGFEPFVREWDEFVRVWRILSPVRLLTTQDCQYILSVSKLFSYVAIALLQTCHSLIFEERVQVCEIWIITDL